jgi:hypothetical protein
MRDFDDSTLWRISEFERVRLETGTSAFMREGGPTLLSSTLLADLTRLEATAEHTDVLEVVAACMRHRASALLCLKHDGLVWPVTVFPREMLFHSPGDPSSASTAGLATLELLATEPAGVKPPGDRVYERIARPELYRPLAPLLWALALHGPRRTLLHEIGGTAAYRLVASRMEERPPVFGALIPAVERLQRESASLRDMASWPGMSVERASRLLNGLYLASNLMVTRSNRAARPEPSESRGGLFRLFRPR